MYSIHVKTHLDDIFYTCICEVLILIAKFICIFRKQVETIRFNIIHL